MNVRIKVVLELLRDIPKSVVPLTPGRQANTFLVEMPDGKKYVLKHARKIEIENHTVALALGLKTPKIITSSDLSRDGQDFHWFVQEYVKSETLEELTKKPNFDYIPFYKKSIDLLITIQNSLLSFEKERHAPLHTYTSKENITLDKLKKKIEEVIEPVLTKYSGEDWSIKGKNLMTNLISKYGAIENLLTTTNSEDVLIKWDYKPNNIMFDPHGKIYCIDWPGVMKGSRWVDLGFLLYDLSENDKKVLFDYYAYSAGIKGANYEYLNVAEITAGLAHLTANCKLLSEDPKNEFGYLVSIKYNLEMLERLVATLK